jgi:hypothetical protein
MWRTLIKKVYGMDNFKKANRVKPKKRGRKLRSGTKIQGALNQKGVKKKVLCISYISHDHIVMQQYRRTEQNHCSKV